MAHVMDIAVVYAQAETYLPVDAILGFRKEVVSTDLQEALERDVLKRLIEEAKKMDGWPGIPTLTWMVPENDYMTIEGPKVILHGAAPVMRMHPEWRYLKTNKD